LLATLYFKDPLYKLLESLSTCDVKHVNWPSLGDPH
jgi:hypothetical protein